MFSTNLKVEREVDGRKLCVTRERDIYAVFDECPGSTPGGGLPSPEAHGEPLPRKPLHLPGAGLKQEQEVPVG